jgi:hypothetical protein
MNLNHDNYTDNAYLDRALASQNRDSLEDAWISEQTNLAADKVLDALKRFSNDQQFVVGVMRQVVAKLAPKRPPTQSYDYSDDSGLF